MAAGRDTGDVEEVEAGLRSDTARVIGFSDAVFAIVITLLVLDLGVPEVTPGRMPHALLEQWPVYLAFGTSFLYVAVNWLNHKGTFLRVRCADRGLDWANLGVLFGVTLLPFVTALVSRAVEKGDVSDERVAIGAYALLGVLLSATWLWLYHYLHRRPELRQAGVPRRFFAAERLRALFGVAAYAIAGLVGWWVSVPVALVVFLLLPLFYGLSSNGSYEIRRRIRRRG
ncbi:TMEM175 family protein [Micromonospora sp. DT227]|uniref:TMEM175 family protein n=1 Tax=Micromonospora sp. DT227 TaxID=3393433 RepID=UPI003CF22091